MIDPDAVAAVRDLERALLLDPDPGLLPVYADALEEAEVADDRPDNDAASADACAAARRNSVWWADADVLAAEVRESGLHPCTRAFRLVAATLLDAAHPMESIELRLSIVDGNWPASPAVEAGEFLRRYVIKAGPHPSTLHASWAAMRPEPFRVVGVWNTLSGRWMADSGSQFLDVDAAAAAECAARCREAARRWIEEAINERDG